MRLLQRGGAEFWLEPTFASLGDPWSEHRRLVPSPPLSERLQQHSRRVRDLLHQGVDDGLIGHELGLSRTDVEAIVRHIQHASADLVVITEDSLT